MNIGEIIVELRKQKGIKQKELAKALGISATYLSLIESNEKKPSVTLIANVANYFDLPITAIFFKAIENTAFNNKVQKKYFTAARPVVQALIDFLLSDDIPRKKRRSLVSVPGKKLKLTS